MHTYIHIGLDTNAHTHKFQNIYRPPNCVICIISVQILKTLPKSTVIKLEFKCNLDLYITYNMLLIYFVLPSV